MHARARTVILLALWWLGGTSLAAAQVPEGSRADSLAAVLNRADRPDRFTGVWPLPRYHAPGASRPQWERPRGQSSRPTGRSDADS